MNDTTDWIPAKKPRELMADLRIGAIWVLFGIGVITLVVALQSLLSVIELWFDYQYVPIARAVMAVLLLVGIAYAIVKLARKK